MNWASFVTGVAITTPLAFWAGWRFKHSARDYGDWKGTAARAKLLRAVFYTGLRLTVLAGAVLAGWLWVSARGS